MGVQTSMEANWVPPEGTETKGLTLVKGYSFESALSALGSAGIGISNGYVPHHDNGGYFRAGGFVVNATEEKVISALGDPKKLWVPLGEWISQEEDRVIYYGLQEISEDFDRASLDGTVRFNEGRLVEKIVITCVPREQ